MAAERTGASTSPGPRPASGARRRSPSSRFLDEPALEFEGDTDLDATGRQGPGQQLFGALDPVEDRVAVRVDLVGGLGGVVHVSDVDPYGVAQLAVGRAEIAEDAGD